MQVAIANAGAVPPLVSMLSAGPEHLSTEKAAGAIGSLADESDANKEAFVAAGAIVPLTKLFEAKHYPKVPAPPCPAPPCSALPCPALLCSALPPSLPALPALPACLPACMPACLPACLPALPAHLACSA